MTHETLSILIACLSPLMLAATAFGGLQVASRYYARRLTSLEGTMQRFGERLGDLEEDTAIMLDRKGLRRRKTRSLEAKDEK